MKSSARLPTGPPSIRQAAVSASRSAVPGSAAEPPMNDCPIVELTFSVGIGVGLDVVLSAERSEARVQRVRGLELDHPFWRCPARQAFICLPTADAIPGQGVGVPAPGRHRLLNRG